MQNCRTDETLPSPINMSDAHIGVLYALLMQLPTINHLLENSFNDLSSTFVDMSEDVARIQKYIDGLNQQSPISADAVNAQEISKRVSANISKVIIGMQFQDRVSQNLVIAVNVLHEVVAELDRSPQNVRANSASLGASSLDIQAVNMFVDILKLGEVKQLFLDFLTSRGHADVVAQIGGGFHGHTADEEDVELF
jgi:hypothetical protein